MRFFVMNGKQLKAPDHGYAEIGQQLIDGGRNALGQFVGQKINRRIFKFEPFEWTYLTAQEWHEIRVEIEKFQGSLPIWNALTNSFETVLVYWGDYTATPFKTDIHSGEVLSYRDCRANIIDMGY